MAKKLKVYADGDHRHSAQRRQGDLTCDLRYSIAIAADPKSKRNQIEIWLKFSITEPDDEKTSTARVYLRPGAATSWSIAILSIRTSPTKRCA